MLELPQVTLCCVDAKNHAMALRALTRSMHDIKFARTIFLTDAVPNDVRVPETIEVIPIGPITSHETYSRIVMKGLYPHVATSHVLLVQWDGYVVDPEIWTSDFLACDYLGAPWPEKDGGLTVGNGGFSLRSRRLLEVLQHDNFPLVGITEDVSICGIHRPRLEGEFGIQFGSPELARRFSFELYMSDIFAGRRTFGFHGVFNFFVVEDEKEIIALAGTLPDSIAASATTEALLRNLVKFRKFEAAICLGRRMLEVNSENETAANAVVHSRAALATLRRKERSRTRRLAMRVMQWLRLD